MRTDDEATDEIAKCLSEAPNPRALVSALGMDDHPVIKEMLAEKMHAWCHMSREVVYHSDQHSLFHQPPPEIEMVDHTAQVAPAPVPMVENTISESLVKLAAIEHLVLGFRQQQEIIYSCTAPMGCIASLQAVLSQDEQMDFADLSGFGVGDVSASGMRLLFCVVCLFAVL